MQTIQHAMHHAMRTKAPRTATHSASATKYKGTKRDAPP